MTRRPQPPPPDEPVMEGTPQESSTAEAEATTGTRATLDGELRAIKDDVLRLGALVEVALERAGRAVTDRDPDLADRVRWDDAEVNDLQRRVSNSIL
ncbi:MAG TPA: PhoU domain-containing protein, partial [Candidatus Limnocylindria bacterium]|nr:PhoU domain-containing protein [Candidatus Limnocylindria bacterium]